MLSNSKLPKAICTSVGLVWVVGPVGGQVGAERKKEKKGEEAGEGREEVESQDVTQLVGERRREREGGRKRERGMGEVESQVATRKSRLILLPAVRGHHVVVGSPC